MWIQLSLLFLSAGAGLGPVSGSEDPAAPEAQIATLQGRLVCLDEALSPAADEESCDEGREGRFGLESAGRQRVVFAAEDPQAAMFADPQLRGRELVVRGWHRANDHFEILDVHSIKDGRRYHIHYRCDVCNITASAPGPCWCCRQPFELREVLVPQADG